MKKKILALVCVVALLLTLLALSGCDTQAEKVSYNLSKEADNFNIVRRLSVINVRDNTPIMKITGKISITVDTVDNQLEIIVELPDGSYQKNFVGLNDWITYAIEQVDGEHVSKYGYEFEWMPESIIPVRITNNE